MNSWAFSFDGGGIRGRITTVILIHLQNKIGRPVIELCDMLAGESTGGLIALGLAAGFELSEIDNLYVERGKEIFTKRWFSKVRSIFGPKYTGKELANVLRETFGTKQFGECLVDTIIVAYDASIRQLRVFKSWEEEDAELLMWQIAQANASAPTYFPSTYISTNQFVDVGPTNPAMCAVAECVHRYYETTIQALDGIRLVSIGTGTSEGKLTDKPMSWGSLQWARHIIEVLIDVGDDAVNYQCKRLLSKHSYFRFQPHLHFASPKMDEVRASNISSLKFDADHYMHDTGFFKVGVMIDKLKEDGRLQ